MSPPMELPTVATVFFRGLAVAYKRLYGRHAFFELGDKVAPCTFNRDQAAVACISFQAVGIPTSVSALLTGWSLAHAKRLYSEWKSTGRIAKGHGGGRPSAVTEEQAMQVAQALSTGKAKSMSQAAAASGVRAHRTTVTRHVKRVVDVAYYKWTIRIQKKPIRLTPRHKAARMAWAEKILKRAAKAGSRQFVQLLSFTDSKIYLTGELEDGGGWVIKVHAGDPDEDESERPTRSKGSFKVHAYGGVTFFRLTRLLTEVSGTGGKTVGGGSKKGVNAQEYQERILPFLLDELAAIFGDAGIECWYFQQDGAPAHTVADTLLGKAAQAIINDKAPNWLWDWPSFSPDLSLIESVWAEVVRRMKLDERSYASLQQFEAHIQEVWAGISADKDYLKKLYYGSEEGGGFLGRLRECVERRGAKTSH